MPEPPERQAATTRFRLMIVTGAEAQVGEQHGSGHPAGRGPDEDAAGAGPGMVAACR